MAIDTTTIADPQVQSFYELYLPQYTILRDFYIVLSAEQYEYRIVDTPERRSDTPRESLAHLLEYRLVVLNGVKTGIFEFKSMGVEHYWQATKEQLLTAWEEFERDLFDYVTASGFESDAPVSTPWNVSLSKVNMLYLLRDHDILHVGWNLALMDHLGIARFPSLVAYWG